MLSAKFVRENTDAVKAMLAKRRMDANNLHAGMSVDDFTAMEEERLALLQSVETLRAERNAEAKETARLKSKSGEAVSSERTEQLRKLSADIRKSEQRLSDLAIKSEEFLLSVPNILAETVPDGDDENANVVLRENGTPPQFDFEPQPHDAFGSGNAQDSVRAAKISAARFSLLKGELARLARAIGQFCLEVNGKNGYEEVLPPTLVNTQSMIGTSQLPKFHDDVFRLGGKYDDLYLISTGEIPLTNMFAGEILDAQTLPLKYTGLTSCYRSEAGAAGRDTRGLIRLHEFHKVEIVQFAHAEQSQAQHEELVSHSEEILRALGLPYRVVVLASGDTGFGAVKCYDIEVYFPAQKKYREVSSCSNFYDFQARRAKIRARTGKNTPEFVHTLNGSALPIERTLAAILENFQHADGTVSIPEPLQDLMKQKKLFAHSS